MEVSPVFNIAPTPVSTSQGGTELNLETAVTFEPKLDQPSDSGPPPVEDAASSRGTLLDTVA